MLLGYELIGNLQVSNGIVSGFNNSTSNYIKIPYSLPMGSNKVEFCLSLYYPSLSSMSTILANYNDAASGGGLVLRSITTSKYSDIRYWAWNSSSSLIADQIDTGFDLTIGTNIIKFVYENSTITWYKSTDGINFTQGTSKAGTIADFQNSIIIGASGTAWYSGNMQVNMLDSYIKVNDEYWHSKEYIKQKTKIIQRHDTAANWTAANPVLAAGEMGIETDTNKFKFGDGTSTWSELAYATSGSGGSVDAYTKTETDNLLNTKQDKLVSEAPIKIYVDDNAVYRVTAVNGNINTTDKTFTGTETGYLTAKEQDLGFTLANYDTWEFRTKIRFATNKTTAEQNIFSTGAISTAFNIYGESQIKWYLSSNGADWNMALYKDVSFSTNTIYYIRLRFTGTQYIMERSTTGFDSMTTVSTKSSTTKVYSVPITNIFLTKANPAYGSTIFLKDTCFIGNGEVIWKAYDESKIGELKITSTPATTSSIGVVQPDGTSITVSETGVISGQDVKTFTGYSDTGTLVLKSINGILQWVAEG